MIYNFNHKEVIYNLRNNFGINLKVRPSVCTAMRFVILHPFDLKKVSKDAEFNEVLHEPLRFPKFSGIRGKPGFTANFQN